MITPKVNMYYRHRYGGVYCVSDISTSTVDGTEWVVYHHIYPFDYTTHHRPYDEWCDGRFTPITHAEMNDIFAIDRIELQTQIAKNRGNK